MTLNGDVTLGSFNGGSGSAQGILSINNGTLSVAGNIFGGGGNSILNVSGGTLVLSNKAGATGFPLTALNLTNAALHLNVNGSSPTTNIVATTVGASGTTIITIDSITNVFNSITIPLISYAGANPFSHFALAALPAGFSGNLVDNSANKRIDLSVTSSSAPPSPIILPPTLNGTTLTLRVNSQSGFDYVLEVASQLAPPNWAGIQTNAGGGTLTFNIPVSSSNSQQFFRIRIQ
ncbi:MAG: hypothetical protein WDM76_06550 [Limisphaerales bacterium]